MLQDLLVYPTRFVLFMTAALDTLFLTFSFLPQVMGSKARIFIVLEYITGGELFETIVNADISSIYL